MDFFYVKGTCLLKQTASGAQSVTSPSKIEGFREFEADLSALFHIEAMAAVRRASKKFYNCRKKELTGIFYRCRIKITSTKVENKSQRENLL